jgi:hypothetical protein
MACYDIDTAMLILRQSIDFAEIERDFVPLRKWANEVERSCHGLEAIEARLNGPDGQGFLLEILQAVAAGSPFPEEALRVIFIWLNSGKMQEFKPELIQQYHFA